MISAVRDVHDSATATSRPLVALERSDTTASVTDGESEHDITIGVDV